MKLLSRLGLIATALAMVIAPVAFARPAQAVTPICVYSPLEQRGSHNDCVGYIQKMLNGLNAWHHFDSHAVLAPDHDFGPLTQAKVKAYQRAMFIKADGIVGPQTWRTLCSDALSMFISPSAPDAAARTTYQAGSSASCGKIVSNYDLF